MSLQKSFPWTKRPLIINAPMGGVATAPLAISVTKSGGLGFIGSLGSIQDLRAQLSAAAAALVRSPAGHLPLGVGLLSCFLHSSLEETVEVLKEFAPRIVWLFGAHKNEDYADWARAVRAALPERTQVWVQVGSLRDALEIAEGARPDVICVQGNDAGGHGLEAGAGVVALLPEIGDGLREAGFGGIDLVAAGGIVDGRGAAAVFALGAQGAVLGTRFLASTEAKVHPGHLKAVLATSDGGQKTVRSKVFDLLRGPNQWPGPYDGRSILNKTFTDHEGGVDLEDIRQQFSSATKAEDGGFAHDGTGRATMWAGTGVGLVKKQQPAAEILEEVRSGAIAALEHAKSLL